MQRYVLLNKVNHVPKQRYKRIKSENITFLSSRANVRHSIYTEFCTMIEDLRAITLPT